ncbi:MAG: prolipoprotein diacylglyceryl transferase [Rickettsiales bacterium]|nr:prolipoprotein diacylglyceryl transferase [Rickettsiales bacterium]
MALDFPSIDPVIFSVGPLAVRWYSLSYIAGILLGWTYINQIIDRYSWSKVSRKNTDDLIVWMIVGIVLGGRLGYTLFYNMPYYLDNPAQILRVWEGGMSFHGGMIGTILAAFLYCRKHNIPFLQLTDLLACAAPIGLFFGRIANFINAELYGRVTSVPWAFVFPGSDNKPRHPSQLYEAFTEGFLLFIILWLFVWFTNAKKHPGFLSGVFLIGYASFRMLCELYREPDFHIGFIISEVTMGQLLSIPMLVLGLYLSYNAVRKRATIGL